MMLEKDEPFGGEDVYSFSQPYESLYKNHRSKLSGQKRIEVIGEGRVPINANIGKVQVGVETKDKELLRAQRENSTIISNIIHQLKKLGINEQQIQTGHFSIYPFYDFINGQQVFAGYTVHHMLSVTDLDLDRIGLAIDTAVKSGANRVANISFSYSNPREIYEKALIQAIQDGINKAKAISQYLKIHLDHVPYKMEELFDQRQMEPFEAFHSVQSASTPIFPEKKQVSAKVRLIFFYS